MSEHSLPLSVIMHSDSCKVDANNISIYIIDKLKEIHIAQVQD